MNESAPELSEEIIDVFVLSCDDTPDAPDSPHRSARGLRGGLFVGIGVEDRQQPVSAHQPFLDVISTFGHAEVKIDTEADHGYTWQDWPSYNPAANDSFAKTIALFGASLRPMSA